MSLGKVELQGVDKARDKAKDILAAVRLGQDPAGEKQRDRKTATETFKAVAERISRSKGGGKDAVCGRDPMSDVDRHLMMHGKPLHGLLLAKIQRQDIASVISAVRAKGKAVTANRVRTSLSSFFSWAIGRAVDHNPVTGTLRTEEKSRERVLSYDELRLIWNALEEDHFGAIIKLLALTGQRAAEISGLRRTELQGDAFTLPPERTKNGLEHTVPLSEPARAIIAAQPRRQGSDGEVARFDFRIRRWTVLGMDRLAKAAERPDRKGDRKRPAPLDAARSTPIVRHACQQARHSAARHRGHSQPRLRLPRWRRRYLQPKSIRCRETNRPRPLGRSSAGDRREPREQHHFLEAGVTAMPDSEAEQWEDEWPPIEEIEALWREDETLARALLFGHVRTDKQGRRVTKYDKLDSKDARGSRMAIARISEKRPAVDTGFSRWTGRVI